MDFSIITILKMYNIMIILNNLISLEKAFLDCELRTKNYHFN
ncbi:hypothetical protein SAMN05421784_12022 [Xenorhabdus koppenhoeferi]|uniref:Uncharacterized protein n=1 Tax=Xenorhabdus koppenhoeferi TaxID=351659 RepID=A0A1I7IDY0_9GAMM|nr:hypothetical protein SAMN05421784_12022 [Xenorhabdus koppenhoeferi]